MRRFAQSRLRLSKTCSARPEPLDLKKAVSAAFRSAREAFLGFLILHLSVSTDVSREIQVRCKNDLALQETKLKIFPDLQKDMMPCV